MNSGESKRGRIVIISGPSGSGKSTVCRQLCEAYNVQISVSATTRPIRPGEVDGQSYCFMTREEFLRREQRQEFLEHAEYDGNLYGTPAAPIREALDQGRTILLDIDVQGGRQFREQIPDALTIFLLPPTKDALLRRLDQRRTDTPAAQERRIAKAAEEERFARESDLYDYFVVNDDLDLTVKEIGDIIGELGESDD